MIKVYASVASVGFLVLSAAAGCSSANTPDEGSGGTSSTSAGKTSTGSAGTSVVPSGGTSSDGGSGSIPAAGTASTAAGTSSTAGTSSGTAGSGTGGTGTANPSCKGIKTGMACMPEGTDCPGLTCGLADTGTRACKCMSTWMCAACDFSASPFKDKPADVTKCTGVEADKVACTEKGKVCDGAAGGEVCACWTDDEGALIWDCDKPPTTWAAATM